MLNQDTVREATRLTRGGQLVEATALLQHMLRGEREPTPASRSAAQAPLPRLEPPTIDAGPGSSTKVPPPSNVTVPLRVVVSSRSRDDPVSALRMLPSLTVTSWGMAPALAAGNTVVAKPAEATPLTALRAGLAALQDADAQAIAGQSVPGPSRTSPDVRVRSEM